VVRRKAVCLRRRRCFLFFKSTAANVLMRLIVFAGLLIFVFLLLDFNIRPILRDIAVNRAKLMAFDTINAAIGKNITEHTEEYEGIVILEKDSENRVTALRTDTIKINRLKADITGDVIRSVENIDKDEVAVPLGSVTGINILSGKGPKIPVEVLASGAAKTSFISAFSSAGINQTRHQIIMESTVTIDIILPKEIISTDIVSKTNVADTVIIGDIPESYTYIDDTSSNLLSRINDYAESD